MRKITWLVFLLCCCSLVSGQYQKKIDSLLKNLPSIKEDTSRSNVFNNLSSFYRVTGNYAAAATYANSALELSKKITFKKGIATAHYNIAVLAEAQGNFAEATHNYTSALEIGKQLGNKKIVAYSYNGLGGLFDRRGQYKEAIENYLACLKIEEEIGDRYGMGNTYSCIGNNYFNQGDFSRALQKFAEAAKIGEEVQDKRLIAYAHGNMGIVYQSQGDYSKALKEYLLALRLSESIGDKSSIGISYNQIGNIYSLQEKKEEALKNYFAYLKIAEELNDKNGISIAYCNIGGIYKSYADYERGLKYFNNAVKIREGIGDLQGLASSLSNIGAIYTEQSDFKLALNTHIDVLSLTKRINDKYGQAVAYSNIGEVYLRQKKFTETRNFFDSALVLSRNMGSKSLLQNIYSGLAVLDSSAGDYKSAYENFKRATLYRDSISNEKNTENIVRLQMQYAFDKTTDSLNYQQGIIHQRLAQQTLISRQQAQVLLLKENELALSAKEKQLQELAYLKTQSDLEITQSRNKENEKQLVIAEQEKKLQQSKLALQESQLQIQNKDLLAKKTQQIFLLLGITLSLLLAFLIYRNFRNQRKITRLIQTSAEKEKVELQLQSLRAQLNPHFMFNSLNAIQELLVTEKNELSQFYLERFAKLLRMLLENASHPYISLRKELNFLEMYLSLESLRIPDLHYSIEIDKELQPDQIMVPNMILQPYIENALWHGLQNKQGEKRLQVQISRKGDVFYYSVKDNGVGRKKAEELKNVFRRTHRSKGMELLTRRFALLSENEEECIETKVVDLFENGEVAGTAVEITVPVSLSEHQNNKMYDSDNHR